MYELVKLSSVKGKFWVAITSLVATGVGGCDCFSIQLLRLEIFEIHTRANTYDGITTKYLMYEKQTVANPWTRHIKNGC